jgi:hypothetical protein
MRENRGVAVAIVVVAVVFLASLPFLVPTTIWVTLTVYTIVKGIGSAPEQADPAAVLMAIVVIVTVFTLAIAAAIYVIGRAMTPKRRRRDDGPIPAFET